MKWVAALLMVLNATIYLSVASRSADTQEPNGADSMNVNIEGMLLLNESSKVESDLEKGIVPSLEVTALNEGSEGSSENGMAGTALMPQDSACYQVGPFKTDKRLATATGWMEEAGIEFKVTQSQARQLKAVRVYLGPFNSDSGKNEAVQLLKAIGLDHFPYKSEDGLTKISLGYFTQEGLAETFLTNIISLGVNAKSELEYRQLGPFHWLAIRMPKSEENRLGTQSWMSKGMDVSIVDC